MQAGKGSGHILITGFLKEKKIGFLNGYWQERFIFRERGKGCSTYPYPYVGCFFPLPSKSISVNNKCQNSFEALCGNLNAEI